jgi:hypothetical protein
VLRSLTSWTGQESVERAAQLAGNKEVKIDLAHDVIQGDFLRDAASGAATSADEDTATASTVNAACSTVYMEADDESPSTAVLAAAAAAGPAAANGTASTARADAGWGVAGAAAAESPSPRKVSGEDVVLHMPDSKTAPGAAAGDPSSSGTSVAPAGGKAPHRCVIRGAMRSYQRTRAAEVCHRLCAIIHRILLEGGIPTLALATAACEQLCCGVHLLLIMR